MDQINPYEGIYFSTTANAFGTVVPNKLSRRGVRVDGHFPTLQAALDARPRIIAEVQAAEIEAELNR